MKLPEISRWCAALIAATVVFSPAMAQDASRQSAFCVAPSELVRLVSPLKRVARRLMSGEPVSIVAVGSSSTAGAGASSPDKSYPSRLAAELKVLLPRTTIRVLNRGIGGEEAHDMVARFDRDVLAESPDLVIWQVGSNSVLRDRPTSEANASLREGLRQLKAADADIILMNPQYAPKVIDKRDIDAMVDLIDATAKEADVDLFQRFAIMRYWHLTEGIPFSAFLSSDELHMNDWSYGCLAKLLAAAIHEAATRATVTATVGAKP